MEQENMEILKFATLQQHREEDRMENKRQQEEAKASVQKNVSQVFSQYTIFVKDSNWSNRSVTTSSSSKNLYLNIMFFILIKFKSNAGCRLLSKIRFYKRS